MDQSNRKRNATPSATTTAAAGDTKHLPICPYSSPETEEDGAVTLDRLLKWFDEETRSGSICISSYLPDSVTINGDEEMCGSSFSAAAATVMAGVDTAVEVVPYFYGCDSPPPEMVTAAAEERIARVVEK